MLLLLFQGDAPGLLVKGGIQSRANSTHWAFGASNLNNENISQMRIWSPNALESVTIPISDQLRFRDPMTGVVYAARNYGTEILNTHRRDSLNKVIPVQTTIGARMIQFANELAARAYNSTGTVTDQEGVSYPKYDTVTPKEFTLAAEELVAFGSKPFGVMENSS